MVTVIVIDNMLAISSLAHKLQSSSSATTTTTTTTPTTTTTTSTSTSTSHDVELAGIFYECDDENRNALDKRQLARALQLVGFNDAKGSSADGSISSISRAIIAAASSSSVSSSSKTTKRASFTSENVKLDTFLRHTASNVDKVDVNDSLLHFLKSGIDGSGSDSNAINDDDLITVEELKHLLVSQSEYSLTDSEVDELVAGMGIGSSIRWRELVHHLCWKD